MGDSLSYLDNLLLPYQRQVYAVVMHGFTAFFILALVVYVCWLSQLVFTLKKNLSWIFCWSTGSELKKKKRGVKIDALYSSPHLKCFFFPN